MAYLSIGLIVGMIMGLTGAGGALVAIPLFLSLLNFSLKEATVLSLLAVIIGTSVNLIKHVRQAEIKLVGGFVFFGALANYWTLPLKKSLPDIMLAAILFVIGVYSVLSVWRKKAQSHPSQESIWKTILFGAGLGILTTLTGLGGGVVLVPILIRFYNKTYEEALPSSLLTILLISILSFLLQIKVAKEILQLGQLGWLLAGSLLAYFVLNGLVNKMKPDHVQLLRKLTFTAVAIYSVSVVIIKSI